MAFQPDPDADVPIPPIIAPDVIARGLDLLPIPAAHVVLDGGRLALLAANRAYAQIGLEARADGSAVPDGLAPVVRDFLGTAELRREVGWALGDAIDGCDYRVTLARSDARLRDRCHLYFLDQTAQRRTERSLRRQMTDDSLTGLPNREGFGDLLDQAGDGGALAVLIVDVARFGRVNACLGSLAGDELLISVARRIRGALRSSDALARIGGDEFGILARVAERAEADHVAHRVRRALATPFRLSDYQIQVDCSLGIAHGSDEADLGDGGEELVRHAQLAVKRAKETGRIETYQARTLTEARRRFGMETALRRAIENGGLHLHYQPICDLPSGRTVAFEALARWRDGEANVPPSDFIPVAEESGLIVPLGRWALEEATRTLAAWDRLAGGCCGVEMGVNLSPIQLARDPIVPLVERVLGRAGLAGARLKLELTESALVAEPDRTAGVMRALKELGATLCMDDFGTGYSNLALLQKLPIDVLKIDRSFVTGMLVDRDKVSIVRAVLSLGQALGMRTVAEGVETAEVGRTLAALGCHLGQGYLYGRPMPAADAYATVAPAAA